MIFSPQNPVLPETRIVRDGHGRYIPQALLWGGWEDLRFHYPGGVDAGQCTAASRSKNRCECLPIRYRFRRSAERAATRWLRDRWDIAASQTRQESS